MAAGIMCRRSKSAASAVHAFLQLRGKNAGYAPQLSSRLRVGM